MALFADGHGPIDVFPSGRASQNIIDGLAFGSDLVGTAIVNGAAVGTSGAVKTTRTRTVFAFGDLCIEGKVSWFAQSNG